MKANGLWRWLLLGVSASALLVLGVAWLSPSWLKPGPSASEHYTRAISFWQADDYRAAAIELKNTLEIDPDHADARLRLGQVYLQLGDGQSAEKELGRAKSLGADSTQVELGLLRALFLQGEFERVVAGLVFADADNAEVSLLRGDALLALKRLDDAEAAYRAISESDSNYIQALQGLARVSMARGDLVVAQGHIDAALGDAELDFGGLLIKGDVAFAQRDFEGAKNAFKKALEVQANHLPTQIALVQSLIELGEREAAEAILARLYQANPQVPVINYLRALTAYQRDDLEAAKSALLLVLGNVPNHLESLYLLGTIHYRNNDLESAQAAITTVLGAAPSHVPSRKLLAAIQLASAQHVEALVTLSSLNVDFPDDVQVMALLGNTYMATGDFDKANQLLAAAAELAPEVSAIRTQLAVARFGAGQGDDALRELSTVVELNPEFARADIILIAMHLHRAEYAEAIEAATRFAAKQPNNPLPHNLIGAAHEGLGELVLAGASYEHALAIEPTFASAAVNLARLDIKAGDEVSALKRYEEILRHSPNQPDVLVRMALHSFSTGDVEEGFARLEQARKFNPEHVFTRLMLSQYYLRNGRAGSALIVAEEALQLAPKAPAVLVTLAIAERANGNAKSALNRLATLNERWPESADVLFELANTQAALGQTLQSRESYERVRELDSNHLRASLGLAQLLLVAGDAQGAFAIANEIKLAHPKSASGHALQGDAHMLAKETKKAIGAYQAALALEPNTRIVLTLSRAHESDGDIDQAKKVLIDWVAEHPEAHATTMALADLALRTGDTSSAIKQYESIIDQSPEQAAALNNLAYLYHQRNDQRALETAKKAHELAPKHPGIMDTYGWLLVENGHINLGLPLLEKSVQLSPNNTEHRLHLAVALLKAKRSAQAREILTSLVNSERDFPEKQQATELLELVK